MMQKHSIKGRVYINTIGYRCCSVKSETTISIKLSLVKIAQTWLATFSRDSRLYLYGYIQDVDR